MATRRRPTHSFTDKSRGERLQKVLAEAGIDSRRHCEEMIEDGRVTVNGEVVDSLPAWVDPFTDRVEVDGQPIRKRRRARTDRNGKGKSAGGPTPHVYVMLNKPANVVSTNADPSGRRRAVDLVQHPTAERLFCVGRLDADSTGLLLLTNDGELANRLTHPSYEVHKSYEVTVKGSLDEAAVEKLQEGIILMDRRRGRAMRTQPVRLKLIKRDRERTVIRMELREGRNRQIRRMLADLGYPVKKLRRVQLGPLRLTGLPVGHWRPLTAAEVRSLRAAARKKPRPKASAARS